MFLALNGRIGRTEKFQELPFQHFIRTWNQVQWQLFLENVNRVYVVSPNVRVSNLILGDVKNDKK